MSNLLQYIKRCKDCQAEILMKNIGEKWSALEKDGSTQHRCRKPTTATTVTATKIIEAGWQLQLKAQVVRWEEDSMSRV